MVRFHPQRPEIQKPTEAAKQFLKNANTYAVLIGKLDRIRTRSDDLDDDEELGNYE
jgi:carbon monoxide dehydrogenase subunit G